MKRYYIALWITSLHTAEKPTNPWELLQIVRQNSRHEPTYHVPHFEEDPEVAPLKSPGLKPAPVNEPAPFDCGTQLKGGTQSKPRSRNNSGQ